MMAALGFRDEASAIAAAWSRGDREAAERAVSDALIDATSVVGRAVPRTHRSLPALRHRFADPEPVRLWPWC